MVALEHALNKVHRIDAEPNFLEKRLRSLKWLGILGVAALASVALSAAAQAADTLFESLGSPGDAIPAVVFRILALALSVGVFATAYRFLPAKEQSWRDVLPGAVVGGVAFELLKLVGNVYLAAGAEGRDAT